MVGKETWGFETLAEFQLKSEAKMNGPYKKTADSKHYQPKVELGPHRRYFDFFGSHSIGRILDFESSHESSNLSSRTNVTLTGVCHGLIYH